MCGSMVSISTQSQVQELVPSSNVSRASSISRVSSTNGVTKQDKLIDMNELPPESCKYGKIKNFSPWLPELDPEHPSAQNKFQTKISNRRTVLCIQQLTAALVLVTNIALTACAQARYGTHNGIGTIYLGASNFCMQLLVAPTRHEVNKAHEKSFWLDIGTPSVRNLRKIARVRALTWLCLGISSALLHLSWNSTVFISTPIYSHTVAFATEDYQKNNDSWAPENLDRIRRESITTYEQLDISHCIDRYIDRLNGGKDVVVIVNKSSSQNDNSSLLGHFDVTQFPGRYWVCTSTHISPKVGDGGCTTWSMNQFRTNWTVVYNGREIYLAGDPHEALALSCRSGGVHKEDNKCGLHFSTSIMTFVCVLNLFKCLLICWTAYYTGKSELLVTAGDALVSFLKTPDIHTQGMSTRSKQEFQQSGNWSSKHKIWNPQKQRWYRAPGLRRWGIALIFCIIVLIFVTSFLAEAIAERKRDMAPTDLGSLWREGLGQLGDDHELITHKPFLLTATQSFYLSVLAANLFQLVFSFFYFVYNGLLTSMSVASELSRYGSARKALRVSAPIGMQRSSHFLSLPYCIGVPLSICSSLMYWFISQSVFFVRTVAYNRDGTKDPPNDASSVGFSPIGIIFAFSLAVIMLLALGVVAFVKKYPDTIPLMSTNSAAISAACHPPSEDIDAYLLPVQWGIISSEESIIGECSFTTSKDVRAPVAGSLYSW